jgi:predicted nucleic acid-binding protein
MFKLLTLDSNVFISDKKFCKRARIIGAKYDIYSADSLYLQTALDNSSVLVSLDDGIVLRVEDKELPIEVYHPKEFPYL